MLTARGLNPNSLNWIWILLLIMRLFFLLFTLAPIIIKVMLLIEVIDMLLWIFANVHQGSSLWQQLCGIFITPIHKSEKKHYAVENRTAEGRERMSRGRWCDC